MFLRRCSPKRCAAQVTNAVSGWVQDSAAQHLPGLLPLLSRVTALQLHNARDAHDVHDTPGLTDLRGRTLGFHKVISARSAYGYLQHGVTLRCAKTACGSLWHQSHENLMRKDGRDNSSFVSAIMSTPAFPRVAKVPRSAGPLFSSPCRRAVISFIQGGRLLLLAEPA